MVGGGDEARRTDVRECYCGLCVEYIYSGLAGSVRPSSLGIRSRTRDLAILPHLRGVVRIGAWQKHEAACRAISEVPGIGRLTATALVATIGDAKTFRSGREFAAFLGLVPRQNGTGGKIRLGSISRRGDPYLRTLLIHGARSVLCHTKVPTAWQKAIQVRRPANVVTVALANKMARIAWAILAHGTSYEAHHVSNRPA